MTTITTSELKESVKQKEDMLLIDVLPKESFDKQHIPGAINVPLGGANFVKDVDSKVRSKEQRIVVYCASAQCDASQKAAEELENASFTNVDRFEDGLEGWFGKKSSAA